MKDFCLLVADFIGVEGNGGFHGGHGEQLEQMVGHHVAESAGRFIEAATVLDANGFGGGDSARGQHVTSLKDRLTKKAGHLE